MRRGTFNTAGSSQRSASFGPVQAVKKTMVAPSALPSLPKTTTEGRSPNVTLSAKDIVPGLKNSKGPTSDSSTTAQKPPGIQISAKDIFRLRYLRFATTDMDATVDFYTTIGMNLDFKSEQGVWVNAGLKDKRNTTNQQQGKSKKDEEPIRLPPIATFTAKKSITGFSFRAPGSASVDPNDNIQLIFEKEIVKDDGKKKEETHLPALEPSAPTEESKDNHSFEYLVIYVHFIDRIIKRLSSKGFRMKMPAKTISDIKVAILKDPSGIEVRLMELSPSLLGENEADKKPWFARLAYYVVPSNAAEGCVEFYENVFNLLKPHNQGQTLDFASLVGQMSMSSASANKEKSTLRRTGIRKPDTSILKGVQGQQFRLVDSEEFVVGLTHTSFYWMANDSRVSACSVCFTERSDVDSTLETPSNQTRPTLMIIGMGFHVSNIEQSITRVKMENKTLVWEDARYLINKVGLIARFFDKNNGMWVEIFTSKIPEQPKAAISRARAWQSKDAAGGQEVKEESNGTYYIRRNHLKGHARQLSEGAIYRLKTFLEEDDDLPSKRVEKPAKMIKKCPSAKW